MSVQWSKKETVDASVNVVIVVKKRNKSIKKMLWRDRR